MASYVQGVDRDDTFTYPHFQKDYSYGVNDVLSISQRLLWQARTSHGCIKPGWLLISKMLNPQLGGRDALGLITVYPRPDEPWICAAALLSPLTTASDFYVSRKFFPAVFSIA